MVQVLRAPQRQGFASQFGEALGANVSKGLENERRRKLQEMANESKLEGELAQLGLEYGLKKDIQEGKQDFERELFGLKQGAEKVEKEKERIVPLQNALQNVKRMQNLRSTGNLGLPSIISQIWDPEVRKTRGEYAQLGKSLIPFATSGVIIRNQREFEEYANKLTDPNITDAEAEGVLKAMEDIIQKNLGGGMEEIQEVQEKPSGLKKRTLVEFYG